jgi:hypothetical protein
VGRDYQDADTVPDLWSGPRRAFHEKMHAQPMRVTIEIDSPELMPRLLASLRAGGCSARRISPGACRVVYSDAETADEGLHELRFFARAWAGDNGKIAVTVRPDG